LDGTLVFGSLLFGLHDDVYILHQVVPRDLRLWLFHHLPDLSTQWSDVVLRMHRDQHHQHQKVVSIGRNYNPSSWRILHFSKYQLRLKVSLPSIQRINPSFPVHKSFWMWLPMSVIRVPMPLVVVYPYVEHHQPIEI
jgi:hypothetical protein